MKTIEEIAKEHVDAPCDWLCANCATDKMSCRFYNDKESFKAGAEWREKELMRWHDPKEVLPNKHHRVLLKAYKNGSVFMEVGSLQATDCGLRFIFSECDGCNVIGWREING